MGALIAVAFLILLEIRLQNFKGGEMVLQVLLGEVVGRSARLALISIFLDFLPLAASRLPLRKNGEKKDSSRPDLSGTFTDDGLAVVGTEKVKHIEAIDSVIEVIAERHIEQRTPNTENMRVRAG